MEKEQLLSRPETINPELSKNFVSFMNEKAVTGPYRVEVKINDNIVPLDIFPTVFPPQSNYSVSSRSIFENLNDLEGLEVADIGTGSGIESIVAVIAGARHVDAADINQQAVNCSKHNIELNDFQGSIEVFHSDLFQNFPKKKYDLIIANLPIVNFDSSDDLIHLNLYDKGLETHKRLLADAKEFLNGNGFIVFTHTNLQSAKTINPDYDFMVMDKLIADFGYEISEKIEKENLGYKWINYKIKLIK